jgi:hypothetical protein
VDRFASNTLRTLGIVLSSIVMILGSLVLLLIALCFGMLGMSSGATSHFMAVAVLAVIAALSLISGGTWVIAMLSRGMIGPDPAGSVAAAPLAGKPVQAPPQLSAADQDRDDHALEPVQATVEGSNPTQALKRASPPPAVFSGEGRRRRVDTRHFSPVSRAAIKEVAYAIVAKVAAEIVLGIVGWNGALGVPGGVRVPFPLYRLGFMVWELAAIAPNLVLLYALSRRPGPRAFSYALVIPTLHLLAGIFGHSAVLAFVVRPGQSLAPLLSIFPLLLDILILYLAWKAIRQTGIEPPPERLIMASVVIFLYTALLPLLVVYLNSMEVLRR